MSTSAPVAQPSQSAPLWSVGWDDGSLPQEMDQAYPPNGEPYDQWTVRFTTRSGTKGSVKIPATQYSAQSVAAAIQPLAEQLEQVHTLDATKAQALG